MNIGEKGARATHVPLKIMSTLKHVFFLEIEIKIPNIAPFAPKFGTEKSSMFILMVNWLAVKRVACVTHA